MHLDISRAYFHAPAREAKYIQIPAEDWKVDGSDIEDCGRLNVSLYGTRDAARNWEEAYSDVLTSAGFARGKGCPCTFKHKLRGIRVVVHGDDFLCGASTAQLHWLKQVMMRKFECKPKIMGAAPSQWKEIVVLNRRLKWTRAGIRYDADEKHDKVIIRELGLENGKPVTTPATKDQGSKQEQSIRGSKAGGARKRMQGGKEDETWEARADEDDEAWQEAGDTKGDEEGGETEEERTRRYRSIAARINYLALDRADLQFAAREASKAMSCPGEKDWIALKRIGRYLIRRPNLPYVFVWQRMPMTERVTRAKLPSLHEDRSSGQQCVQGNQSEVRQWYVSLSTQTDSDWATDPVTRRSVSAGAMYIGKHMIKSWSKVQALTALSTAEAELYAACLGSQQAIGMQTIAQDMGIGIALSLEVDATAAIGIMNRTGLGRMRHVDVRFLWLQDMVRNGGIKVFKVLGTANTSDLGTKALASDQIEKLIRLMGYELDAHGRGSEIHSLAALGERAWPWGAAEIFHIS